MISKKSGQIHELAVPKAGIVTADPNDVVGKTFPNVCRQIHDSGTYLRKSNPRLELTGGMRHDWS